jgi:hypothetical protein
MVQQDKVMEQGVRGSSSLTRVWIVLALSVVTLIPALPISLGLSLVALVLVLQTRRDVPHRRRGLLAVLIWIGIQVVVTAAGIMSWLSFQA